MRGYIPRTSAETELVRHTLAVYRELRSAGRTPSDAWQRIDGLTDSALVEAAMDSGAPIVDNAGHLTVIGELEYDGPRCAGDCGAAVDSEGSECSDCRAESAAQQIEHEPRLVVDEDCPRCAWPERFFAPSRGVFGCTRRRPEPCSYESTERTR